MSELYIGLMSGTSLDAVDAVVASINHNNIDLVAKHEQPFPENLRKHILSMCNNQGTTLSAIGSLDHELGKLYAHTVNKLLKQSELTPAQITAIGNHGQTVFHQPTGESPFTIQLGDSHIIAALTGINTVADFRRLDMALGGQGAPLTPAFHQFVFANNQSQNLPDSTIAVVNIGGISNVTLMHANDPVTGFDTGPGNLLMDAWCEKHTGKRFDKDAQWARTGKLNNALLNQLMADPFIKQQAPKSTGREHYHVYWLETQIQNLTSSNTISPHDVQRTLCEFTACAITHHLEPVHKRTIQELLICGGGAKNPLLVERLSALLPNWQVKPTTDRGIPVDCMEAMAFAWLARQRIHNLPSNLPTVTGARKSASLGVLVSVDSINAQKTARNN